MIFLWIGISLIVLIVLCLRYRYFLKMLKLEDCERRKAFKPMLSDKVPYELYQRIAAKGPVKTSETFKGVEFWEIVLENSEKSSTSNNIESNLANIDVGETTL